MVAFNFMNRFADSVTDGSKRQTIRARGKRQPPIPGQMIQLYTGMRTLSCRKLREAVCISVDPIDISPKKREVRIARATTGESGYWDEMTAEEINQLVEGDGFSSADDFFAWFEKSHGDYMSGYLIRWDV